MFPLHLQFVESGKGTAEEVQGLHAEVRRLHQEADKHLDCVQNIARECASFFLLLLLPAVAPHGALI